MGKKPTYDGLKQQVQTIQKELQSCRYAGEELRRSKYYLDCVTAGMHESLVVIDRNFLIKDVNDQFLKTYGTTREQTIGRPCHKITHGLNERCSSDGHPCPARQVFQTGKAASMEHVHQDRGGRELTVEMYAFPLFGEDGQVELVVEVQHDIGDRKRAEEERILTEKLNAILEMAGAVCHELNQPLQVVSAYAERLQQAVSEDNPLYGKIVKIIDNVNRMADITRKLQNITTYETIDYVQGEKIIDIHKASQMK